jgi:hypothetical protein
MSSTRRIGLALVMISLLLLSGCDVFDMILDDMLRDILSKLNPFTYLFGGNGTTAIPPTGTQAAGAAVLTTAIVMVLALSNGAFQNLISLLTGGGHASAPASGPAPGGGASGATGEATPPTEPRNADEFWEMIKRGGPEAERLTRSLMDQKLAHLAAGTALPETVDIVGAPPTQHETYDKLRGAVNQISGGESPDEWINISALLDKGTTVRSAIVGLLTMAGVSFTTATAPWIIGAGLAAGLIDKYGPDSLNIVEMFFEPGQPDTGSPEPTGPVFTPVVEKFPPLKKEDLWKLPRDERIKMWQDSRDWIQKLTGSDSPTTVEEWERRYNMANRFVNEYEQSARDDPNILDSDDFKKWRYQRELLDTLRATGPRMELQ